MITAPLFPPAAYPRKFLSNTKQPLWFSRMVPNRPIERDLVHMFLVCSLSSIEVLRFQTMSVQTHSVIYECKEVLWWMRPNQFKIRLVLLMLKFSGMRWFPASLGMVQKVYFTNPVLHWGAIFTRWSRLLSERQGRWDQGEMGKALRFFLMCNSTLGSLNCWWIRYWTIMHLSEKDLSLCAGEILVLHQWSNIRACLSFLLSIGFHVLLIVCVSFCVLYFVELNFGL
jgi:hypothetical protein